MFTVTQVSLYNYILIVHVILMVRWQVLNHHLLCKREKNIDPNVIIVRLIILR
jgi:hypothetical protein